MTNAVIVSTARTPLAKSWKGAFNMTHGASLGGHAVQHAVQRAGIDAAEVEDVIMGCATPEGATGANIARQIALKAGMPISVSGMTVNRFVHLVCRPLHWLLSASLRVKAKCMWPVVSKVFLACSKKPISTCCKIWRWPK